MAPMLITFVILLLAGIPIAFVLGWSSIIFALTHPGSVFLAIPLQMFSGVDQFIFMAIPLFMLAGDLMVHTGIMESLLKFCILLLGRFRGSLAHVSIVASMIFAGISGSAVSDAAAIGGVLIPAMSRLYDRKFAAGVVTAASTIGPIIPPSIPMIIYSMSVGGISIGGLFLAGFVPGLMIGLGMMAIAYVQAVRRGYPVNKEPFRLKEFARAFVNVIPALLMPIIILGGILGGVFTATEAAAVAVLYALIIGFVVTKRLTCKALYTSLLESAKISSMVFLVISTASVLAWMLIEIQFPQTAAEWLKGISKSPFTFLVLLNVFLLFVGCILEPASAMVMLMPILSPIAETFGIHPLHLGIVVVTNLVIGLITPPVGTCLFVGCGISKLPVHTVARAMLPYFVCQIAVLFLITYIPRLALFIPSYFGMV